MPTAIEDDFPVTAISQLAERESWRKEIYRPPYYLHKWWARRLGSVFRAIILAACLDDDQDVTARFYQPTRFPGTVVFDPFMGSGTTIGEAVKLGCRAIGRDINPVSAGLVATALQPYNRDAVKRTFQHLQSTVAGQILDLYRTRLPSGARGDVLYYFWVKTVPCPRCRHAVELFKSRVFARHAYPRKHPAAKAICPACSAINDARYDDRTTTCYACHHTYDPQIGPVDGAHVTCPACRHRHKTIDAVRATGAPPQHTMYAKMVLSPAGQKTYLPIDEQDHQSYHRAEALLPELWDVIPQEAIEPGYNTNQVLNYNYHHWYQMFNARQLVTIALLAREIRAIPDSQLRMLFAYLLSGTLEFNNMFCSFKGEGTGAVRHMFSHHILKPELTPLEANLWGTPKSSGSFSTLFKSRILRALDYKDQPFELHLQQTGHKLRSTKVYGLSLPLSAPIATRYEDLSDAQPVYLSCGDSAHTDIADDSVDLVVTDPPFFDNVHYSQLADFFHVWLRHMLPEHPDFAQATTRSPGEVQDTEAADFANKLSAVLLECRRVLKNNGLLVLTYHHSRIEGWTSVYSAIREAGFHITHTQPVKAEMAVSVPIKQSNSPVHFDLILVCRKWPIPGRDQMAGLSAPPVLTANKAGQSGTHDGIPLLACMGDTKTTVQELKAGGIDVSVGDIKVMLMGTILSRLAALDHPPTEVHTIAQLEGQVDALASQIQSETDAPDIPSTIDHLQRTKDLYLSRTAPLPRQLGLLLDALERGDWEEGTWHIGTTALPDLGQPEWETPGQAPDTSARPSS